MTKEKEISKLQAELFGSVGGPVALLWTSAMTDFFLINSENGSVLFITYMFYVCQLYHLWGCCVDPFIDIQVIDSQRSAQTNFIWFLVGLNLNLFCRVLLIIV